MGNAQLELQYEVQKVRRREAKRWQQRGARRTGGTGSYIGASARLPTEKERKNKTFEQWRRTDANAQADDTATNVRNLRAFGLYASREMRRALSVARRVHLHK